MPECIGKRFCSIGLWCLQCTGMFTVVLNIGIVFELVGLFVRATTLLLLRHVRVCFVSKIALVVVWACLNGLLQLGRFGRLRVLFSHVHEDVFVNYCTTMDCFLDVVRLFVSVVAFLLSRWVRECLFMIALVVDGACLHTLLPNL